MTDILIIGAEGTQLSSYFVYHLSTRWINAGHQVTYTTSTSKLPNADIVFLHIDRTFVPEKYYEITKQYPVVINRHVFDISRRRYSKLILEQGDDYVGQVIVKTNYNYGGFPELRANKSDKKPSWRTAEALHPLHYVIYESIADVPPDVWLNTHLIVERFVSERVDNGHCIHYCSFLGDKVTCGYIVSDNPIVKFGNAYLHEKESIIDEVKEWRKEYKIDYGRFDYALLEGKPMLIDVNKTQGGGGPYLMRISIT